MSKTPGKGPKKLKGLDTLISNDPKPFVIKGHTYVYDDLGIKDTSRVINILKEAFNMGAGESKLMVRNLLDGMGMLKKEDAPELQAKLNEGMTRWAALLAPLVGIPDVIEHIMVYLNTILFEVIVDEDSHEEDRAPVDVFDKKRFPAGSELILFAHLGEHPAIVEFQESFMAANQVPGLKKLINMLTGMIAPTENS